MRLRACQAMYQLRRSEIWLPVTLCLLVCQATLCNLVPNPASDPASLGNQASNPVSDPAPLDKQASNPASDSASLDNQASNSASDPASLGNQVLGRASDQASLSNLQAPAVSNQVPTDTDQVPAPSNDAKEPIVQDSPTADQISPSDSKASHQIKPTHGPLPTGQKRPPKAKPAARGPPGKRMPPPPAPRPPKRRRMPVFLVPSSETSDDFDGAQASFVYILPSRRRQCFHHRSARPFVFEFRILHGGKLDADAYVVGPDGRIAFESRGRRQGRYAVPAAKQSGGVSGDPPQLPLYTICVDNRYSSWYAKVIDFSIQLPKQAARASDAGPEAESEAADSASAAAAQGPLSEELTTQLKQLNLNWAQFLSLTDAVENNLHQSAGFQRQFRRDEVTDRMAMEDSATCVTQWSLMQLVVMTVVSALQVLMIRALFDEKSVFHRVWRSRGSFLVRS